MKWFSKLLPLLLVLGLNSCDVSKYPIDDEPNVKVDKRLIGTWKGQSKKGKPATFMLKANGEYRYALECYEQKKEIYKYDGYLSYVGNSQFLNISSDLDSNKTFVFFRLLKVADKTASACFVDDSMLGELNSSAEVREKIRLNLDNPYFFKDTIQFLKVK